MAKELQAVRVKLNGPRVWVLNDIIEKGETDAGKIVEFGGMQMKHVATVTFTFNYSFPSKSGSSVTPRSFTSIRK
jgi:hypothetical protein